MFPRNWIITLIFVVVAISCNIPRGFASEDLIVNGGFETGSFEGWTADRTCQVRPHEYPASPTHRGNYSASIGTVNPNIKTKGSLSQTIKIPEDSRAAVSFWYRVEKGSSLDFYLRDGGGSMIQNWTFQEKTGWTPFVYELSPRHAGKSIVLVFEGRGFMEMVWVPRLFLTERGLEERYVPVRVNYYPYIDDVSVIPQSASVNLNLKISGLPSELSTKVLVDGRPEEPVGGGDTKTLRFKFGEPHNLTVEEYVYESDRVRYVCGMRSVSVNASTDETLTFNYKPQYRLALESAYGVTEGSGWYDDGVDARFSVSPATVQAGGALGSLGVRYVFQGWSGDLRINSTSGEVKMDSPKRLTAVWQADYLSLYIVLGVLGAAVVGLSLLVFRKKQR